MSFTAFLLKLCSDARSLESTINSSKSLVYLHWSWMSSSEEQLQSHASTPRGDVSRVRDRFPKLCTPRGQQCSQSPGASPQGVSSMKSFIPSMIVAILALFSSNVFAAATDPIPTCPDKDSDGYAVCDSTCTVSGTKLKCGDCAPDHEFINPGVNEAGNPKFWNDGLNNDCKVSAWESTNGDTTSLGEVQVGRFSKGLGRSITPKSASELQLLKEIMVCKAGNCTIDYVGGKLTPAAGYRKVDVDCDGVFNVVPDTYTLTLKDQDKCKKVSHSSAPAAPKAPKAKAAASVAPTSGTTTPTADPAAPKAPAKVVRGVDYSAPIAKAQATADKALQVTGETAATVKTQGEKLSALDQAIADQKTAISAETARATTAEGLIDTKAQAAIDRATEAVADASAAKASVAEMEKQGFFGELSLGGATLVSHDAHIKLTQDSGTYKKGDVLQMRGNVAPGGYVGLNVGYQNEDGRFNGFFNLLPLADEGPKGYESSIAYQGGVEATLTALHGLGFHAMFLQHDAGGSVVGANSYSRGFGGGLSYNSTTVGSNFKVGFQGRATVGVESYGAGKGSDTAPFAGITLGINFGFGPK